MKNQALFSSKDKSKKLKCRLLQFLFGALRAKRFPFRFKTQTPKSFSSASLQERHNGNDILFTDNALSNWRLLLNEKLFF